MRWRYYSKIPAEGVSDQDFMLFVVKSAIRQGIIDLARKGLKRVNTMIQVGENAGDFEFNLKTLLVEFTVYKAPRICMVSVYKAKWYTGRRLANRGAWRR